MTKKSHKSHSQPRTGKDSGNPGLSGAETTGEYDVEVPETGASLMETMQEGLNTGIETVQQGLSSGLETAKDVASDAAYKVETMMHDAQDAIVETGQAVIDTAKKNPLPLALAGIGVACAGIGVTLLVLNSGNDGQASRGTAGQGAGRQDGQGRRTAVTRAKLAEATRGKLGDATRTASEAVGKVVQGAKVQSRRASSALRETYESNPLAVGAAVIATGTIVGLAIPSTKREDQLLGQGRDQVVHKAENMAKRAIEKVDRLIHPSSSS
jgi:hypothetical protein